MLPSSWNLGGAKKVTAEEEDFHNGGTLDAVLALEGREDLQPIILEGPSQNPNGNMLVRVPFYVSNSLVKIPDFDKRIFFAERQLNPVIAEAKAQLAEGKQPLTVYGRHAHAISASHLPAGRIVDLMRQGSVGYADLEIAPTSEGRDIQILAERKMLNAVSLRCSPRDYELTDAVINGEDVYLPTRMKIAGIDFAPDRPAMQTYGLEVLAAEARVEEKNKEVPKTVELTLEAVRADPEIVAEIERPLRNQLSEVLDEKQILAERVKELERVQIEREKRDYAHEVAAAFPEPDKALPVLLELATQCESKEAMAARAMPVLLKARQGQAPNSDSKVSLEERMNALFPGSGAGQQEANPTDDKKTKSENAGLSAEEPAEEGKTEGAYKIGTLSVPD
jgi:hypothetical protein